MKMEWISVKDRLPELKLTSYPDCLESEYVLCYNIPACGHMAAPQIYIFFLYKYKDEEPNWMHIGENYPGIITHWMPLPEPPKS